jgi:hypothetical protein
MIGSLLMLLQQQTPDEVESFGRKVINILDTPAPYSPFSEYLLVLFILWLIARRARKPTQDFSAQAQEVLDEKFKNGEIDRVTYEKYRQELSMRIKKE